MFIVIQVRGLKNVFLLGMEKDKRKLTEDDQMKLKWDQINTALKNDENVSKTI